jgi:hypothetical protein
METPGRWHTDALTHPPLWRQGSWIVADGRYRLLARALTRSGPRARVSGRRPAEALGIPGPGPTPRGPIPILTPECGSFAARRLQDGIREAALGDGPWRSR